MAVSEMHQRSTVVHLKCECALLLWDATYHHHHHCRRDDTILNRPSPICPARKYSSVMIRPEPNAPRWWSAVFSLPPITRNGGRSNRTTRNRHLLVIFYHFALNVYGCDAGGVALVFRKGAPCGRRCSDVINIFNRIGGWVKIISMESRTPPSSPNS